MDLINTIVLAAMLCHVEPGEPQTSWHYRTKINPWPETKCYYQGERMKPRKELYWAETPARAPTMEVPLPPRRPWELEQRFQGAQPGWDHKE